MQYAYDVVPEAATAPCAVFPFLHFAATKKGAPVHFSPSVLPSSNTLVHEIADAAAEALFAVATRPEPAKVRMANVLMSCRFISRSLRFPNAGEPVPQRWCGRSPEAMLAGYRES